MRRAVTANGADAPPNALEFSAAKESLGAFTAHPDASRLDQLADEVARSEFTIPIARGMKLSEIREAHRLAESGGAGGKIILVP